MRGYQNPGRGVDTRQSLWWHVSSSLTPGLHNGLKRNSCLLQHVDGIMALTLQATGPVPRRAITLKNKGVELRWHPGTTVTGNSVRLAALFRFASASGEPHDDKGNFHKKKRVRLQLQSWGACAVAHYAVDWGHRLSKSYTVVATSYTTSDVVRAWEHVPELFFFARRGWS